MPSDLKQRIQAATLKSLTARNRYNDQVTAQLTQALKQAEDEVARAILQYRSLGSLPDNKLAALKGLEKLQLELDDTMKRLKREQTLVFRKTTKDSFKLGIQQGIGELADAALPFYADLKPEGIDKLATKVFTIVDTNALDFMAQYNLTLAGDVHREFADGIKRTILNGVATGKGADDIVRDMGKVIIDKDSFRQAGSRVFSKAQYRMEMIARTEVLRAHNMGRLKFHERVGIQKLEWLAMEDERMCPVCGGLDGKTFPIDKFPQQPAHPHCRCTNIVAWPMTVCGSEMATKADAQASQGDACILPPHVLEGMADAQAKENAKLKSAFETGDIADLGSLTVKQLQTLAKQNGVAIARTKADFIKLLDLAEPGIDHGAQRQAQGTQDRSAADQGRTGRAAGTEAGGTQTGQAARRPDGEDPARRGAGRHDRPAAQGDGEGERHLPQYDQTGDHRAARQAGARRGSQRPDGQGTRGGQTEARHRHPQEQAAARRGADPAGDRGNAEKVDSPSDPGSVMKACPNRLGP